MKSRSHLLLAITLVLIFVTVSACSTGDQINICDRTSQVQKEILYSLSNSAKCDSVTLKQLEGISTLYLKAHPGRYAIKEGDLDDLSNLKEIHFGRVSSFPEGIFDNTPKLKGLYVADGTLVSLPDGIFDNTPELDWVNLNGNNLRSLPEGVFDNTPKLTSLDLLNNDLISLPDGVFDNTPKLNILFIGGNNLTSLQPGIFENLLELEYLYAEGNQFDCIPHNAFGSRTDDFSKIRTVPPPFQGGTEITLCDS